MSLAELANQIDQFICSNWSENQNEMTWRAALTTHDWLAIDWPENLGGTGWSREEQWLYIELTSNALCPLPDKRFTIIAPLLLALGTEQQQQTFLPLILDDSTHWDFMVTDEMSSLGTDASHVCVLDDSSGSLFVFKTSDGMDKHSLLGTAGEGRSHLAFHQSTFLNLAELKTSQQFLLQARAQNQLEPDDDFTMLELEINALEAQFLAGQNPELINLRFAGLRTEITVQLHDALGYYGLASPDALLSDNEPPLPFASERKHLEYLRQQLERDTHLLKDDVFNQVETSSS